MHSSSPRKARLLQTIGLVALVIIGGAMAGQLLATESAATPSVESEPGAGLVIDDGDGEKTYAWIPLPDNPISAMELINKSGLDVITVGFGGLGEGVCSIERTGCDPTECRSTLCQTGERNSPFWNFLVQDEDGSWRTAPLGGSAVTVEPGDIVGWVWTGERPEDALDSITMAGLRDRAGDPDPDSGVALSRPGQADADTENATSWLALVSSGVIIGVSALVAGIAVFRTRRSQRTSGEAP